MSQEVTGLSKGNGESAHLSALQVEVLRQDQIAKKKNESILAKTETMSTSLRECISDIETQRLEQEREEGQVYARLIDYATSENPQLEKIKNQIFQAAAALSSELENIQATNEISEAWIAPFEPLRALLSDEQNSRLIAIQTARTTNTAVSALRALHTSLTLPEQQWKMLTRMKEFPREVLFRADGEGQTRSLLDEISSWLALRRLLESIENTEAKLSFSKREKKQLRAHTLTVFFQEHQESISPALLNDMIEGRLTSSDELFEANIFATLEELQEKTEHHERTLTPTQRLLVAAIAGIVIGFAVSQIQLDMKQVTKQKVLIENPSGTPNALIIEANPGTTIPPTPSPTATAQNIQHYPPITVTSTATSQGGTPISVNIPGNQTPENSMNTPVPSNPEGASANPSENATPTPEDAPPEAEHSSVPENSGELPTGVHWEIHGEIPTGYFRTGTFSVFSIDFYSPKPLWTNDNSKIVKEYDRFAGLLPKTSSDAKTEVYSKANLQVMKRGLYNIPVPPGYRVVSLDVGNNESRLMLHENGSYKLWIDTKESVPIHYGLMKTDETVHDEPTAEDRDTRSLIGDIENLPPEVQALVAEASQLDSDQKAEKIRAFVKGYFKYSIDPKYNAMHTITLGPGEFIKHMFEFPFGDCDTVNTVAIGLYRAAGGSARQATGYMNGSTLFGGTSGTLDKKERHGWGEYYSDRAEAWVEFDATPTIMDEYTKEKFAEAGALNPEVGLYLPTSLEEALLDLKFSILSLTEWLKVHGIGSSIAILVAAYIATGYFATRSSKKNIKRIEEIQLKIMKGRDAPDRSINYVNKHLADLLPMQLKHYRMFDKGQMTLGQSWLMVTLIPQILIEIGDRKKIAQLKKNAADPHLADIQSNDYAHLLCAALGISEQDARQEIVERNTGTHLEHLLERFDDFKNETISSIGFNISLGKGKEQKKIIKNFAETEKDLNSFLNKILNLLYDSYLVALKRSNRRHEHSELEEGKKTKTLSFEEFAQQSADCLIALSYYWEFSQTIKKYSESTKQESVQSS